MSENINPVTPPESIRERRPRRRMDLSEAFDFMDALLASTRAGR